MARGLHVATQTPGAPSDVATPLPDPTQDAQNLLSNITIDDNVEAYLVTFERVAIREDWPLREWAHILAPLLTGEAQIAYFAMPEEEAEDYHSLKTEMLACCGLSST